MIKDGYDEGGGTLTRAAGALGRLHTFAARHHSDDVVDKISGLTGEDLATLLGLLEKIKAIALPTKA